MYAIKVANSRKKLPSFSKSPKVTTLSIIKNHLPSVQEEPMGAKKRNTAYP